MTAFRFQLGRMVATPAALALLERRGLHPAALLRRHVLGDWGDLCAADLRANEVALVNDGRLLSSYQLDPHTKVWIITEADRSATTILLPEDY